MTTRLHLGTLTAVVTTRRRGGGGEEGLGRGAVGRGEGKGGFSGINDSVLRIISLK